MYYWTTYYSRLNTVFSHKNFVLIDRFRMTDLQKGQKNKTNEINKLPTPNKIQLVLEDFCMIEKLTVHPTMVPFLRHVK
jgi:hypothetical protein